MGFKAIILLPTMIFKKKKKGGAGVYLASDVVVQDYGKAPNHGFCDGPRAGLQAE